jgi:hypothetical protein
MSVQATAADAVKLDLSKATGSDSHNVSLNPKPCLSASLLSCFLSVDMKQANDVVQGRKHLNVVELLCCCHGIATRCSLMDCILFLDAV